MKTIARIVCDISLASILYAPICLATWGPLGSGVSGMPCLCATEYGDRLVVGGAFTEAGGQPAGHIAMWDGASWSPMGNLDGWVEALAVYNGELIAGGSFGWAGGVLVNHVAAWDGTAWHALGSGINGSVSAFAVYNGSLYACGSFDVAGGIQAHNIARWDGVSWSPLGSGLAGGTYGPYPRALAVFNGQLVVGGSFSEAGGIPVNMIASWDGSSWSALGSGVGGGEYDDLSALAVYAGNLYAGGDFYSLGQNLAGWDGSSWYFIPRNWDVYAIRCLRVYDNKLIAGGWSATSQHYIAAFDGSNWNPLGTGLNHQVEGLGTYDGKLIAMGFFVVAGGVPCNHIAWWFDDPGACCHPDGTCSLTTQTLCEPPGLWQGPGTVCEPNPCPPGVGACCQPDGTCTVTTEVDCPPPNTWMGASTGCAPSPCPQPDLGACCAVNITCSLTDEGNCPPPSEWLGPGTLCFPNPCGPRGACCFSSQGLCEVLTFAQCSASQGDLYVGDGTTCDPDPCPASEVADGRGRDGVGSLSVTPNPFTGPVELRVALGRAGHVELEVFDLSGRRIHRLGALEAGPGVHLLNWDGRGPDGEEIAPGVYFVRGTIDGQILSTTLIHVR